MKHWTRIIAVHWVPVFVTVLFFGPSLGVHAQHGSRLTAKVASHQLATGVETELQEARLFEPGTGVVSIGHKLWRTGIYHRKLERFILLHHPVSQVVSPIHRCVTGLPQGLAAPGGMPLEELGDGWLGTTFQIAFLDPGVYVLQAEWTLAWRDQGAALHSVTSNPVVLFVKPSADYEVVARRRAELDRSRDEHGIDLQEMLEQYYNDHHSDPQFNAVILSLLD